MWEIWFYLEVKDVKALRSFLAMELSLFVKRMNVFTFFHCGFDLREEFWMMICRLCDLWKKILALLKSHDLKILLYLSTILEASDPQATRFQTQCRLLGSHWTLPKPSQPDLFRWIEGRWSSLPGPSSREFSNLSRWTSSKLPASNRLHSQTPGQQRVCTIPWVVGFLQRRESGWISRCNWK